MKEAVFIWLIGRDDRSGIIYIREVVKGSRGVHGDLELDWSGEIRDVLWLAVWGVEADSHLVKIYLLYSYCT